MVVFTVLICAFLLHQHHRRSAVRRGEGDVKGGPHPLREPAATPCTPTPNLLEMQLLRPPRANGQPAWSRNPNIADVDVLQVDAASVTSSMEDQKRGNASYTSGQGGHEGGRVEEKGRKRGGGGGGRSGGGGGRNSPPAGDDLRNYAYEGEGSSPGSLSSCKS
ncbi:putative Cadherin cytoplasmic region-containing protein [Homarus americanus]|uniref:Putative Cadherin cytoplasmic region-containing protein n=1 Tax=Homarus americanus TaxID=6706 RepID=A0A8J5MS38_HOMAM|nr:putative Cadherin cytoplasmic region-containing protein [Homarus americanus]